MNRYQLYLNPHSVTALDEVAGEIEISRSKIIQGIVDRFATEISKFLPMKQAQPGRYPTLDKLAGFVRLNTKKKTDFARHVDDIYDDV